MNTRLALMLVASLALMAVGILSAIGISTASAAPTWEDAVQEAKRGGYRLLTTAEVQKLYENRTPGLLLVDTRQEWEHRTGHIAGSVNFSMEPTAWARWTKRGDLEKLLGPDKDRPVIFY
jgi:3-mercaptopyruvate sulfurtransferase SseA